MKPNSFVVLLSAVSLGACGSFGSADPGVVSQERVVPPFSAVTLDGVGTVRICRGPQAVRVTLDGNIIDNYETVVKGDTLYVGFRFGIKLALLGAVKRAHRCEVEISVPELDGLTVNGSGSMYVEPFAYGDLRLEVNGAAVIELHGTATGLDAACTGACTVRARDLVSKAVSARLTGSCSVEVRAEEVLDASISGAGELVYWGDPRVSQRVSGAGSIRRGEDR